MKNWLLWLIAGVLSLLGGVLALMNPLSATMTASTLAGGALLIVGAIQGYTAWKSTGFRARLGAAVAAAAAFLMGILLFFGPFGDGSFLRISLAQLLIASGAAKLWSGRQIRGDRLVVVVAASGAISICLGLIISCGIPGFLAGNHGVVLGLELLASGAALIVLSLRRQKTAPTS